MKILIADEIFKDGNLKYTYNEAEDLEIIGDIPDGAEVKIENRRSNDFVIGNISIINCGNSFGNGNIVKQTFGNVTYINGRRADQDGATTSSNPMSQRCANLTKTGNVGKRAKISSVNSNITVNGNVNQDASIHIDSGSIEAKTIHQNTHLKTGNGNVKANIVHNGAIVEVGNGRVKIRDDRRSQDRIPRNRRNDEYSPFNPNFGANLSTCINNTISAALGQSFSNSSFSEMSSSDSEDDSISTSISQRQAAQSTAPSMPPSYEEVIGSSATARTGMPPACSRTPQEDDVTMIVSNFGNIMISSSSSNSQRR